MMAESEGIAKNLFNIIDGCYYIGVDAVIEDHADARGGQYAKVYGSDKTILDTGWSSENAWVGLHQLSIRWYSDLAEDEYGLLVEYWKRDSAGNESLAFKTQVQWNALFSDEMGNGIGLKYFTENYEYRIVVKSYPAIAEDKYVAVDYIRILPTDMWASKTAFLYSSVEHEMTVQNHFIDIVPVTGDGSGFSYAVTVNIPSNEGVLYAVPVVSVLDNVYVIASTRNLAVDYSSFEIVLTHKDNTVWSGSINVCLDLTYYPIITML
jgi:hypothetical protein